MLISALIDELECIHHDYGEMDAQVQWQRECGKEAEVFSQVYIFITESDDGSFTCHIQVRPPEQKLELIHTSSQIELIDALQSMVAAGKTVISIGYAGEFSEGVHTCVVAYKEE
jgi:hypothetical protein